MVFVVCLAVKSAVGSSSSVSSAWSMAVEHLNTRLFNLGLSIAPTCIEEVSCASAEWALAVMAAAGAAGVNPAAILHALPNNPA